MTHDFRETKIKILSAEHSRAFQEAVIAAGGRWHSEEDVMYLFAKFLFVDADLNLGFEVSDSVYFDCHKYTEIQFPLPTKGHPHAEPMAQYAEDAKSHAEPWKLWQIKTDSYDWIDCKFSPAWDPSCEFRRKPKTHIVHSVEIPDLRVSPEYGDYYYLADPLSRTLFSVHENNKNPAVEEWVKRGLVYQHTEGGKQAAILHSQAMLGIK